MRDFTVIDGDSHIVEMDWKWDEFLEPKYRDLVGRHKVVDNREVVVRDGGDTMPVGGVWPLGRGNGATPGGFMMDKPLQWSEVPKATWDAGERLKLMDEYGMDISVQFPSMANRLGPHPN